MKKIFYFLSISLMLNSCSTDAYFEHDLEDISNLSNEIDSTKLKSADGKYRVLGHGYDITGDYLNKTSIRALVIDLDKLQAAKGTNIIYYNSENGGSNEYFYGYNGNDYLNEISEETGFSATVSGNYMKNKEEKPYNGSLNFDKNYKNKYSYSSKYSFASLNIKKYVSTLRIEETRISELAKYVTDNFINRLNDAVGIQSKEDQFIEDFGTHILASLTMGGTATVLFRSAIIETTNNTEKKTAVKVGLNATLSKVNLGANVNSTVTHNETISKKNKEIWLYIRYKGGNGIDATYNLETGMPSISTKSWSESVNANNAGVIEVDWKRAVPIYDLITDATKKARIKAAVDRYTKKNQIEILELKPLYRMFNNGIKDTHYYLDYHDVLNSGDSYRQVDGYILIEIVSI